MRSASCCGVPSTSKASTSGAARASSARWARGSVLAAADCEVLFLDTAALSRPHTEHSWQDRLLRNLLRVSMKKNLALSRRILCTAPKTVRGRLLTYLSGQAVQAGGMEFDLPFNRQQLADYLNLDRSALSKELCRMRDEGLLTFRKNHFVLRQLPELL